VVRQKGVENAEVQLTFHRRRTEGEAVQERIHRRIGRRDDRGIPEGAGRPAHRPGRHRADQRAGLLDGGPPRPSTNTQVSAHAIIQDELAHANIAYRLLEDLGESKEALVYGRAPHEFKHPYGFDQPLENWAELVVANGFFDRAGITLLSDVTRTPRTARSSARW
jgi:hypothetical protein